MNVLTQEYLLSIHENRKLENLFNDNFTFTDGKELINTNNSEVFDNLINQLKLIAKENKKCLAPQKTVDARNHYVHSLAISENLLNLTFSLNDVLQRVIKIRQTLTNYLDIIILNSQIIAPNLSIINNKSNSLNWEITKSDKSSTKLNNFTKTCSCSSRTKKTMEKIQNYCASRENLKNELKGLDENEKLQIGLSLVNYLYEDYESEELTGLMLVARAFDDSFYLYESFDHNIILITHFKKLFKSAIFDQFDSLNTSSCQKSTINWILTMFIKLSHIRSEILVKMQNFNVFYFDLYFNEISSKYYSSFVKYYSDSLASSYELLNESMHATYLHKFWSEPFIKCIKIFKNASIHCVRVGQRHGFDEFIKKIFDETFAYLKPYLHSYYQNAEIISGKLNESQIIDVFEDIFLISNQITDIQNLFQKNIKPHKLESRFFFQVETNLTKFIFFNEMNFTSLIDNILDSGIRLIKYYMVSYKNLYIIRNTQNIDCFKNNFQKIIFLIEQINCRIFRYFHSSNRKIISHTWALKLIEFINKYYMTEIKCDQQGSSYILKEITLIMIEFQVFQVQQYIYQYNKDITIDHLFRYHFCLYGLLKNIYHPNFISNYQKAFKI
ncbi:hypothetical protein HZS_5500, partial [Henneguya salminicola]